MSGDPPYTGHEKLLRDLVAYFEKEELPWYEKQVRKMIAWWHGLSILSLGLSVLTSVLAATLPKALEGRTRLLLVALPIVTAGVGGLIQLFRFKEKEALRETGRIEMLDMIHDGRSRIVTGPGEDAFRMAYDALRTRFHQLEIAQHQGYVSILSEPLPKPKGVRRLRRG